MLKPAKMRKIKIRALPGVCLATISKLNLEPYFKEHNKNTGRVKQIASGLITVNVAKSWGVGDIVLEMKRCIDFSPKFDDRVYLCRNEFGEMFVTKMTKSRQEGIWSKKRPKRKSPSLQEPL
jgi:hypothetical protein